MSKLYTRTGDRGETGLLSGERVSKTDARVEAYGTLDETNAFVGAALVEVRLLPASPVLEGVARTLESCQDGLMRLAACVASGGTVAGVTLADVEVLERAVDEAQARLPALTHFVFPGTSRAEAALHMARTVCRRAERRMAALADGPEMGLMYLNRLSDLLFALARLVTAEAGAEERIWARRR